MGTQKNCLLSSSFEYPNHTFWFDEKSHSSKKKFKIGIFIHSMSSFYEYPKHIFWFDVMGTQENCSICSSYEYPKHMFWFDAMGTQKRT